MNVINIKISEQTQF